MGPRAAPARPPKCPHGADRKMGSEAAFRWRAATPSGGISTPLVGSTAAQPGALLPAGAGNAGGSTAGQRPEPSTSRPTPRSQ
eukprot:scaffold1201_cov413-Prasinococcus_capsulatus_cf.AAC.18